MNTSEMKMSSWEAREKWLQYSRAVKERYTEEDDLLRRAYRELSLGRRIINWQEEIAKAGMDARGFPKLGIARPEWTKVAYGFNDRCPVFWRWPDGHTDLRRAAGRLTPLRIQLPRFALPIPSGMGWGQAEIMLTKAIVPTIPPQFRPATNRLSRYAILFEPTWESLPKIDPILLLPIGGGLAVVCAQWDMTPLERSVLFGK